MRTLWVCPIRVAPARAASWRLYLHETPSAGTSAQPQDAAAGRSTAEVESTTWTIVSIYATLWHLQFPRHGDTYRGCEWVEVLAQGVPAHIGTPTPGHGYESGDPCESFLPPALRIEGATSEDDLRAVVFVVSTSKKGTSRSGQEYESPLLVLTGPLYSADPVHCRRRIAILDGTDCRSRSWP
jgi:hypothetical protein